MGFIGKRLKHNIFWYYFRCKTRDQCSTIAIGLFFYYWLIVVSSLAEGELMQTYTGLVSWPPKTNRCRRLLENQSHQRMPQKSHYQQKATKPGIVADMHQWPGQGLYMKRGYSNAYIDLSTTCSGFSLCVCKREAHV